MKKISFFTIKRTLGAIFASKIVLGYLFLQVIFLIYLILPSPKIPQIEEKHPFDATLFYSSLMGEPIGVYYTNLDEAEVISFYLKSFSRLPWLNLPLPARVIRHQPEYANEIINKMHNAGNTSFLIEINQPLRESIILQGYGEVDRAEREKKSEKELKRFEFEDGRVFFLRVALYQIRPSFGQRLLSWLTYLIILPLVTIFLGWKVKKAAKAIKDTLKINKT